MSEAYLRPDQVPAADAARVLAFLHRVQTAQELADAVEIPDELDIGIAISRRILNAPTTLMKKEGYGSGYEYDHDTEEGFSGQDYFPDELPRARFYDPPERGFEREIRKRLEYWSRLRRKRQGPG